MFSYALQMYMKKSRLHNKDSFIFRSFSTFIHGPNISATPITAMGCRQCLHLTVVQLKGKHCRKPHCRNRVVDTLGHCGHQNSFKMPKFVFSKKTLPSEIQTLVSCHFQFLQYSGWFHPQWIIQNTLTLFQWTLSCLHSIGGVDTLVSCHVRYLQYSGWFHPQPTTQRQQFIEINVPQASTSVENQSPCI